MPCRYRRLPELTPQEIGRFWSKVDKSLGFGPHGECWKWTGATWEGYPRVSIRTHRFLGHRIAYSLGSGDPEDLCVCHRCDTPLCVNPAHLFIGTLAENNEDRRQKDRSVGSYGDANGTHTHPERVRRGAQHPSRLYPETRPRGERVNTSKLTPEMVRQIRTERSNNVPLKILAAKYDVSLVTISKIARRKDWKHVN